MIWTALRVVPAGVVYFDEHLRRLGPAVEERFRAFARDASPGAFVLRAVGDDLEVEPFTSSMRDAAPVRTQVSPFAGRTGAFPKPARPSPYHSLRVPGTVTLLTSTDGRELFETCAATLVSWDGGRLVLVPDDRPRVDATSERFLARTFDCLRRPIPADDDAPLLAINAVKGTCTLATDRAPFPFEVLRAIEKASVESARR